MNTSQTGPEARYLARFSKIRQQNGETIKNIDSAGNLTEHITQARASLKAQEANTRALFATAQELIAGIDTTQQMLGHSFVKNMPLPSKEIAAHPGKQLGYVQLALRFLQAGVIHFMEQMSEASDRIDHLENVVSKLAVYDEDMDLLGELHALDLDTLESSAVNPITNITEVLTDPITPPKSPSTSVKESRTAGEKHVASAAKKSKK